MLNKNLLVDQVKGRVAVRDILGWFACCIVGFVLGVKIGILLPGSLWPVLFGVAGWIAGAFFWRLIGKHIFRSTPKVTIPALSANIGTSFFFIGVIAGDYVSRQIGLPVWVGIVLCAVIGFIVGSFLGAASTRRQRKKEDKGLESK